MQAAGHKSNLNSLLFEPWQSKSVINILHALWYLTVPFALSSVLIGQHTWDLPPPYFTD